MFPVEIFSPLPHDASPGPATTHTVQPCPRTYARGAGELSHPSAPKFLPKRSAWEPAAIFDHAELPVLALF